MGALDYRVRSGVRTSRPERHVPLGAAAVVAAVAALAVMLGAPSVQAGAVPTVKVGAIITYTGPTSDVGVHYADGIRDYFRWLAEEKGGVVDSAAGPVRVELVWTDDQYNPQMAVTALQRFISEEKIVALISWGTGPNVAMKPVVNSAHVPTLSASFHAGLLEAPGAYNFFISMPYDDHMRILLNYIKEQLAPGQAPRIAFSVHPSPYGRSPLAAGKAWAEQMGWPVVAQQELASDVLDATSQVLELRRQRAEFVLFQNTAPPVAVFLRDARRNGLRAQYLAIHYAGGEELLHLGGANADGVITTSATVTWPTDVPGMAFVRSLNQRYHPDIAVRPPHYAQGVVTAQTVVEGIRRARALTGEGVKDALEALNNFDTGGVAPPITFTPQRHWGADYVLLYRLSARDNRLDYIGQFRALR
ncbi:MAG: ABC transporter substrate-binding protein [Bacillota bacterium]